ncbi:MAG: class I SAM-dependent methyltransferase [Oscillochloridaceae bacterium]|nr:class I SAM-dependent methyltransferase [Chloroflexaceae bacterium]MDW8389339.1 class I SAM-dependent methyltransferase [Oscillochloridaceae bacterium]
MAQIVLKAGRERPIQQRHPWIFSGAIAAVRGNPANGAVVDVLGPDGAWLARGFWSSRSQIRLRVATWEAAQALDDHWLRAAIARAVRGRAALIGDEETACRLVFSEADGLPGLIVDRYGPYLVIQLLTQGMAMRTDSVIAALVALLQPRGIYERSDPEIREKEGLPIHEGQRWGEAPPERLTMRPIILPGMCDQRPALLADLRGGQKTGFYLDQAINRARVGAYCQGAEVLDGFAYTGGFSVYAARAGAAALTLIDSSGPALALARANLDLNGLATPAELIAGDVFRVLRQYRDAGRRFDVIILDPPKFAHSQAQVERAARGYKDINLLALQLLRPGGLLATFSCSGLVSADLFQKIVFGAALDARRDVQIIERFVQAPDHPVLLSFPESEYLKGLLCRVW